MISNKVQQWLDNARSAASGGNAQPWSVYYEVIDERVAIQLSIDPEYILQASAMDVNGVASAIALGCLAENLMIVAGHDGYLLKENKWNLQKTIELSSVTLIFEPTEKAATKNVLSIESLFKRWTNRNPYKTDTIDPDMIKSIYEIFNKYSALEYAEVKHGHPELIKELSKIEKVRWTNEIFLKSMLAEIVFDSKQNKSFDGIPAEQLGISFFEQKLLKLTKKFFGASLFIFKAGLYRLSVKKNVTDLLENCDRIFFLQAKNIDFKNCFEMGLCFQEVWLQINNTGVAFQPIGSFFIPLGYWHDPARYQFNPEQMELLQQVTMNCKALFSIDLKKPTMAFRIGLCDKQQVGKSLRKPVVAQFKKNLIN